MPKSADDPQYDLVIVPHATVDPVLVVGNVADETSSITIPPGRMRAATNALRSGLAWLAWAAIRPKPTPTDSPSLHEGEVQTVEDDLIAAQWAELAGTLDQLAGTRAAYRNELRDAVAQGEKLLAAAG